MSKNIKISLLVFVGFAIISNVIAFINGTGWFKSESTTTKQKEGKEIIRYYKGIKNDWSKSFLTQGEFYQSNTSGTEVMLKLNDDNTYSFSVYQSGELIEKNEGSWRTKVLKEKKIKDPISYKILILDNQYLFDFTPVSLFNELCLRDALDNPYSERLIMSNYADKDYEIDGPLGKFIAIDATSQMLCKKYDLTKHKIEYN